MIKFDIASALDAWIADVYMLLSLIARFNLNDFFFQLTFSPDKWRAQFTPVDLAVT